MLRRFLSPATAILLFACTILVLGAPGVSAEGGDVQGLERIIATQEKYNDSLLAREEVVGTAAGAEAVIVLVKTPRALDELPDQLDGVPVRVRVCGDLGVLSADSKKRFERPVPIGVSSGNERRRSAGTIACRVTDGKHVYALSTNHVYALENSAPVGSKILQPGLDDSNGEFYEENVIGRLYDYSLIVFSLSPDTENEIDAAIARCTDGVQTVGVSTPEDGYGTPGSDPVKAEIGMGVQKYGKATRLTHGKVTGVNAVVKVRYESGVARFVHQILVEGGSDFVKKGDSGALLVTDDDEANPVGLVFAGGETGTVVIANPIQKVLKRFSVEIDTTPAGIVLDIAVTDVSAPESVTAGDVVEADTVRNEGNQDVDEPVRVTLTDETDGETVGEQELSNGLPAGSEKVVTFVWSTAGASTETHLLTARHGAADNNPDNDSQDARVRIMGLE